MRLITHSPVRTVKSVSQSHAENTSNPAVLPRGRVEEPRNRGDRSRVGNCTLDSTGARRTTHALKPARGRSACRCHAADL